MRTKVSVPTNGSVMILNARPENGALSSAGRLSGVSPSSFRPSTGGMSSGLGR